MKSLNDEESLHRMVLDIFDCHNNKALNYGYLRTQITLYSLTYNDLEHMVELGLLYHPIHQGQPISKFKPADTKEH
jgi:hypothetical protein